MKGAGFVADAGLPNYLPAIVYGACDIVGRAAEVAEIHHVCLLPKNGVKKAEFTISRGPDYLTSFVNGQSPSIWIIRNRAEVVSCPVGPYDGPILQNLGRGAGRVSRVSFRSPDH